MVPALYFTAPIFLCQPFLKLNRYKNVRRGGDGENQMRRRASSAPSWLSNTGRAAICSELRYREN